MRAYVHTLVAAALLGGLYQPADAQRRVSSETPERGWVGISLDVVADRWGRPDHVVILDVNEGSPAEAVGLRPGDRVLSINELDRPEELATLTDRLWLRPGDAVAIQVLRDGRRERFRLEAGRRPSDFAIGRTFELTVQADSMVETWMRAMDSLRVELVSEEAWSRRFGRTPPASERRITVVSGGSGRTVEAPFEYFLFRAEEADTLHEQALELNRSVTELERRLERREAELRERYGSRAESRIRRDDEHRRMRQQLSVITERSDRLEAAMAEAARISAEREYGARAPGVWSKVAGEPERETTEFRPLTPYLLGRNRVAGAEVVDLRPELAQYFSVAQGVLVVDVAPGTPAAIAGIVPGDVITRLDQVGVRTVEDLRFGVSMAGEVLPISLIRRGTSLQVLLRR